MAEAAGSDEIARLRRRLERERKSRLDAEEIAERGMRALYDKQRHLELLESAAVAANEAASLNNAIRTVLVKVCEFTGWTVANAFLVQAANDGEPRLFPSGTWHTVDSDPDGAYGAVLSRTTFARGEGLPGRVLANGLPAWVADISSDSNFPRAGIASKAGLKSAFAFPVKSSNNVSAVLEFFSPQHAETDDDLLRLMDQIGNQLGRVVDRMRSQEQLVYNALHDALTGLPNRTLFLERLNNVISRKKRSSDVKYAALFIDIDRFKVVNDSLGHITGDSLIVAFGQRVAEALNAHVNSDENSNRNLSTTLARFGGDEFVILVENIRHVSDAIGLADAIQTYLERPFVLGSEELFTTMSIGVVADPDGEMSAEDVLRNADLALYRAKGRGKAQHALYDDSMHVEAMRRLKMESDLRAALRHNEFIVHYQPIVALADLQVVGFEALVRWLKNGTELIPPGDFIELAEDTGLILPIGMSVFETACRTFQQFSGSETAAAAPYVAVNLSARQFSQHDLVANIASIIRDTGIDPARVRLEVTESAAMIDGPRAKRLLSELRALGVQLAIDDFGTGYSSLSSLHEYPLEILKIDRSFVNRMVQDAGALQIVKTIINLARCLDMKVVAEGVETLGELDLLKEMGCDLGQGYYFSRPVPEAEIGRLLSGSLPEDAKPTTAC